MIQTKDEYTDNGTNKLHYDATPHAFSLMDPMPRAIYAMRKLSRHYNLNILSTAPWLNLPALSEKLELVQRYFGKGEGFIFYMRLIISHHKYLNRGDFLINDRKKNDADQFKGD